MQRTLSINTVVLPGHRVEVFSPELPIGAAAVVSVEVGETLARPSLNEVLGAYSGNGLFHSDAEVEAYLATERQAWDN